MDTRNNVYGDVKHSETQAARNLVRRAKHGLRYSCCLNNFVKDLQGQEGELIKKLNHVNDRLKKSKTQVINVPVVHAWIEREANPLKGNVEELLKEVETKTKKSFCFVPFPNWTWRHRMAKKLAKKKVEVQRCIKEGDMYIKLEDVVSPIDTQNLSSEKSLTFDSRKEAYRQLMEALKDDKVTMIGLYGMGGCGKTMMAEELKRVAEAEHLFNEVPFVIVSNNNKVQVRSIQDKIARALKFPFLGDGDTERVENLRTKLTGDHKKTLLILDDVWQVLNFRDIGIPFGENHKNCKVLITTRSEEVCALMHCQRMIPLSILSDDESWALFQNQAHISEDTSDNLKHLGRKISKECKGLPVAIAALAGTLKDKTEDDWKSALNRLRNSIPVNIEKSLQNPYNCLRVSYDNLENEEAKSLFLLCNVFPEDSEIPVEDLTRFAIGLGLVGEVQSFEGARDKVSAAKEKLISSCLLSLSYDSNRRECVKMHNLVRDVALWIASEENKVIRCLLEKDMTLECSSIRYLWCKEFPNELDCSSLEFLHIETYMEVSDDIFKGMESVRVLFLSSKDPEFGSLSTMSLKSLTNLRYLFLKGWKLGDISSLGYMKSLEILALHHCSFFELPDVLVTHLTNLRLLHLSKCGMKTNPFEVIGRHSKLEELYFHEIKRNVSGLQETCNYYFRSCSIKSEWFFDEDHTEFFKEFRVPQALKRYQIKLGNKFDSVSLNGHRTLVLSCLDTSNVAAKQLAKNTEVLYVGTIKGDGKNIIPCIFQIEGGRVMNCGLTELWLDGSKKIECLVDTSNHSQEVGTLFSKLRKLTIKEMDHLGALYRGVHLTSLFETLEQLYIDNCPVLTCLFTPSIARSLVRLESLKISECEGLTHILADDDIQDTLVFPELKQVDIRECSMLEYIIPITFAQGLLQLESLNISDCSELKYVFGQRTHGDQNQNELMIELPALKNLQLTNNDNIMSIFPHYCSAMWPLLHEFQLENCPKFGIMSVNTFKTSSWKDTSTVEKHFLTSENMTINQCKIGGIFCLDGPDKIGQPVSLRLQYLNLWRIYQMKSICVGLKNSFTFEILKTLKIRRCDKLEVIFPASVLKYLPELRYLEIAKCRELKQIIEEEDREELLNLVSPQPCFPKLVVLIITGCHNLKRLFSVSTSNELASLEFLMIEGSSKLEELIGIEQGPGEVKVELPKLQILVLAHFSPCLEVELEFPTLTTCLVHDCPRLSLTSSFATLEELEVKIKPYRDCMSYSSLEKVSEIACEDIKQRQFFTPGDNGIQNPEMFITHKPLEKVESPIETSQSSEGIDTTTTIGEVSTSMKPTLPTSGSELATPQHKIPSSELQSIEGTETTAFGSELATPLLKIISYSTDAFSCLLNILIRNRWIQNQSIEGKTKVGFQEDSTSEAMASVLWLQLTTNMSSGTEGNGCGVVDATHNETGISQWQQTVDNGFQERSNLKVPFCDVQSVEGKKKVSVQENSTSEAMASALWLRLTTDWSFRSILSSNTVIEEELDKEFDAEVTDSDIPSLATSPTYSKLNKSTSSSEIEEELEKDFDGEDTDSDMPSLATSPTYSNLNESGSSSKIEEESEKEFVGEILDSDIPCVATSPTDSKMNETPSWDYFLLMPHSNELVLDGQSMSEPSLMNLQEPLGEIKSTIKNIAQSTKRGIEEEGPSQNVKLVTLSTLSKFASPQPGPLITSQHKSYPQSIEESVQDVFISKDTAKVSMSAGTEGNGLAVPAGTHTETGTLQTQGEMQNNDDSIRARSNLIESRVENPDGSVIQKALGETESNIEIPQTEIRLNHIEEYTDKEIEGHPINIKYFEDPINLFQLEEKEDDNCQIATHYVSIVPEDHSATKENLVAKVVADLEKSLKMPLMDIASSEANSLCLLTSLKFLSHLRLKDGVKAIIDSLHQEFPSIIRSFKQAFVVIRKFAVLEENERYVKEQIIRLEKEIKDDEADMSSFQEEKKKCIVETIELKKELENVRRDKSQMMEDQRKAQQQVFEVNYKWLALCSRYELI